MDSKKDSRGPEAQSVDARALMYAFTLQQLKAYGRKTKLQWMQVGLSSKQIENFVRCGILGVEIDPTNTLSYYAVPSDDISS